MKIIFSQEFLKDFDGSQEELDSLYVQIREAIENGNIEPIDDKADYPMLTPILH
jgi:hypothetical protein